MIDILKEKLQERLVEIFGEPHTSELREKVKKIFSEELEKIALNNFSVRCDEKLNPISVVNNNELKARITIDKQVWDFVLEKS